MRADPALSAALHFASDDLLANRNGILSPRQKRRLSQQNEWLLIGITVITAVILIVVALTGASIIFLGIGAIFSMTMLLIGMASIYETSRDLRDNQVHRVTGIISKSIPAFDRNARLIKINNLTFSVYKGAYNAFRDQQRYTIYYISRSKMILSAELTELSQE